MYRRVQLADKAAKGQLKINAVSRRTSFLYTHKNTHVLRNFTFFVRVTLYINNTQTHNVCKCLYTMYKEKYYLLK